MGDDGGDNVMGGSHGPQKSEENNGNYEPLRSEERRWRKKLDWVGLDFIG